MMDIHEKQTLIIIGIVIGVSTSLGTYWIINDLIPFENKKQEIYDNTFKILNNTNVSCSQLIDLRLKHISDFHQSSFDDPLSSPVLLDLDRDLYNAKNCGPHWG